ncbi:fimbrial protein [Enterobacter bugandensis]|uniref:fimbrial protein n=1 Tax=Enterobacter bugandensis TaxID=881260 RepID=UPI0022E3117D|nr:fimbrial protein [Enterobacter bugandensis]
MLLPLFNYKFYNSKGFIKKYYICLAIAAAISVFFIKQSHAAKIIPTTHFHGTLYVIDCNINTNTRQIVDFGDAVGIHRIDGKHYEQKVPFTMDCKNNSASKVPALTLTLEGKATTFDASALATNINGLGIELRINDVAQPLNQPVTFDYKSLPVLTAVPVADPSVQLSANGFHSTLKLTVEVA